MVGVESASRFIGLFRSYEGVTPGEYREKWRRK
jgi:AraC-like DNA-binding protein